MLIGIDLDHTIIYYDDVFLEVAKSKNLIPNDFLGSKADIKDYLIKKDRDLWLQLQGHVYSEGINRASLTPSVYSFIEKCHVQSIPIVIISHKTKYGHFTSRKVNLRAAAIKFLTKNNFFSEHGLKMNISQVYFESTRDEKINQINKLGCTHFIDDLVEVLTDNNFPKNVKRYLYSPKMMIDSPHFTCFQYWEFLDALLY